uniref:Uncharacterized protein n=1 Tax=Cacopsylla melanoneura TaxID=428564 RepID=A0A8D8Z7A7_9HEMI
MQFLSTQVYIETCDMKIILKTEIKLFGAREKEVEFERNLGKSNCRFVEQQKIDIISVKKTCHKLSLKRKNGNDINNKLKGDTKDKVKETRNLLWTKFWLVRLT